MYRATRRAGRHRNRETIQRHCETFAKSLQVGLFLCPTTEKSFGVTIAGKSIQLIKLGWREEVSCDFGVLGLHLDAFEIYADVGVSGDRDKGKIVRVREIEFEQRAYIGAKVGLAECVVHVGDVAGLGPEIAPQEVTQYAVRDNEAPSIALISKTRAAATFLSREGRVEPSRRFRGNVQRGAPSVHFARPQLNRSAGEGVRYTAETVHVQ